MAFEKYHDSKCRTVKGFICMYQKVLCFTSASGGTGKSTITKEIAAELVKSPVEGHSPRVCIVDIDYGHGSQDTLLGLLPKYSIYDVRDALLKDQSGIITDWNIIEKYISYSTELDIHLVPELHQHERDELTADEFCLLINSLRSFYDYILIDTGQQLTSASICAMRISNYTFYLIEDSRRCVQALRKLFGVFQRQNIILPHTGIIINKISKNRFYSYEQLQDLFPVNSINEVPQNDDIWKYNNAVHPAVNCQNEKGWIKAVKDIIKVAIG